jgi:hypothetical protein
MRHHDAPTLCAPCMPTRRDWGRRAAGGKGVTVALWGRVFRGITWVELRFRPPQILHAALVLVCEAFGDLLPVNSLDSSVIEMRL